MKRSIKVSIVLAAAAAVVSPVAADDVYQKSLLYGKVQVIDAKDFQVFFQLNGRTLAKPLDEVSLIQINNQADFNQAETHVDGRKDPSEWKPETALTYYNRAVSDRNPQWLTRLISYRKLRALSRMDRIDQAVEAWLALIDSEGASAALLAARPTQLAAKGASANAAAIPVLKARAAAAEGDLKTAVGNLLLSLYQKEGRSGDAASLAAEMAGGAAGNDPNTNGGGDPADLAGRLRALRVLLKSGQDGSDAGRIRQVEDEVQKGIRSCTEATLPEAMFLLGKARYLRWKLATNRDEKLLKSAGLDLMRVVTFYPSHAAAPEALYTAGLVNEGLGNDAAASRAWREVVAKYPGSAAAAMAKTDLQRLEKK